MGGKAADFTFLLGAGDECDCGSLFEGFNSRFQCEEEVGKQTAAAAAAGAKNVAPPLQRPCLIWMIGSQFAMAPAEWSTLPGASERGAKVLMTIYIFKKTKVADNED